MSFLVGDAITLGQGRQGMFYDALVRFEQGKDASSTSEHLPVDGDVGQMTFSFLEHIPVGYVECDGREYSAEEFPQLFHVIGNKFGLRYEETSGETFFKVPNLQNYFLRVAGGSRKPGTFEDAATSLPSKIPFATQEIGLGGVPHVHDSVESGDHDHMVEGVLYGWCNQGVSFQVASQGGQGFCGKRSTVAGKHNHTILPSGEHRHDYTVIGGDDETRPKNFAVKCMIRAVDIKAAKIMELEAQQIAQISHLEAESASQFAQLKQHNLAQNSQFEAQIMQLKLQNSDLTLQMETNAALTVQFQELRAYIVRSETAQMKSNERFQQQINQDRIVFATVLLAILLAFMMRGFR